MMDTLNIVFEGGGDSRNKPKGKDLRRIACRAFGALFKKAYPNIPQPRFVCGGGRQGAFDRYVGLLKTNKSAMLLVDSEDPVIAKDVNCWKPWEHLKLRDKWVKPDEAEDEHCHLMVQCMESWLVCDARALENYYGQGFKPGKLPSVHSDIEKERKDSVIEKLTSSTKECTVGKRKYSKGRDSFELLARIDPQLVIERSPWAKRFFETMASRLNKGGG